jgi:cytochrome c oxidase assembly protein subunit 15
LSKSSAALAAGQTNRTLVSAWLYLLCFMIWIMVGIGGYTRETGSGLSIMNWDPIIGALPPLNTAAWNKLFALYQTIPQAQILHKGMDLAGFKTLFWPEYLHRLWGRLMGVALLVPLIVFALTGRLEKRLIPWLFLLFIMGGLQGAIGWFMVSSGFFAGSTAVEPWRLSLHFSAAMVLYVSVLWTALTVHHPAASAPFEQRGLQRLTLLAILLLFCTMFAGSFVAGTHAISVFDPAKSIGIGLPPPGYPHTSFLSDQATILFNHQALATLTTLVLLITATKALRSNAGAPIRDAGLSIAGLVLLQFTLGVSALVSKMIDLGVAHQMNAVLLLTASIVLLHRLRGATA